MKTPLLTLFIFSLGLALAPHADAAVLHITSITTSPAFGDPESGDALLSSITVNGTDIHSDLAAPTSVTGNTGTVWIYGQNGTNPGSVAAAVSDLNIVTGSLNTGVATIYGFTQPMDSMSLFFATANYGGDSPASVTAVNSLGQDISNPISIGSGDIGGTLISIETNRSDSGTLNRTVRGFTFLAGDFTFINGNDVSDFAGFHFGSSNYDVQDVGMVVPEPTSAVMLLGGLGLLTLRRRRSFL